MSMTHQSKAQWSKGAAAPPVAKGRYHSNSCKIQNSKKTSYKTTYVAYIIILIFMQFFKFKKCMICCFHITLTQRLESTLDTITSIHKTWFFGLWCEKPAKESEVLYFHSHVLINGVVPIPICNIGSVHPYIKLHF